MASLSMYNFITLNGFYKGEHEDISWHQHGGEEAEFSIESLGAENALIFGRVTYDMMASFWPTPMAAQQMPEVAAGMNRAQKIVFSRSMQSAGWQNTRVIGGDIVAEMRKLKAADGPDMTILGSGSIVTQLAEAGLIDTYLIMIDSIAIGRGTPVFSGISLPLALRLVSSRTFQSGVVLLEYAGA